MKNKVKKVVLLCTALMTALGSYAISTGGAVAVGLGAAAAVTLVGVGVHKHRKHRRERCEANDFKGHKCEKYKNKYEKDGKRNKNAKQMKKDLRHEKHMKKKELTDHRRDLKKMEREGNKSTPQADKKRSMIKDLETDIDEIIEKLKYL
jgi:hypothetical protein